MEKSRRPADFLTIDPSSTFMTATSSRNFEELPENFLESANSPLGQGNGNDGSAGSPQLASLAPMTMASSDQRLARSVLLLNLPTKSYCQSSNVKKNRPVFFTSCFAAPHISTTRMRVWETGRPVFSPRSISIADPRPPTPSATAGSTLRFDFFLQMLFN